MVQTEEIIGRAEALFEDLTFTAARDWKAADESRKVIGYMPIYVPREIIHAAGMLPMGVLGGGDQLEVIHGDAYYQSYICRIPRSTVELGVSGRLDFVDGMMFPSICDVIRNLSGMWQLMFPELYVKYFDVPKNYIDDIGGNFYVNELQELREGLEKLAGREITDDDLRRSIAVYNENRRLVGKLYDLRAAEPWKVPASEVYLVIRAGMVLPVEEHSQMIQDYIGAVEHEDRPMKDNTRVVVTGLFCEQPPLNLIKSLELAGCYVVDDDCMLVTRWLLAEWLAVVVAILGASFIFALAHYLGPLGDPPDLHSFLFRWMAGLLFTVLYYARGFAITAYAHALYDVRVLIFA